MKRQVLKSLAALCAGVMTLGASSSLFVSCDKYDDSELREQISALDKRVQNLESLKAQLEALTARVDALYTLKFQVAENNELQYSFDGGNTWKSTGIVLANECDCVPCDHECPPCQYVPCDHECPEVSLVDNGDSVTIKVGDAEFTIEKPEEIVFELRAGKLYFESEGTMTVAIKSSGIDDITVMAAPKGWYAEINADGKVEVIAPNYDETQSELDYDTWEEIPAKYAASGYVKVHACSTEGKCMVGKLAVEVVKQPLVVKAYGGNAYFTLAGTASYWAPTFYYGISTRESLEADTTPLFKAFESYDYNVLDSYLNNWGEETEVTVSIEELLGEEPQVGQEYVVWALLESNSALSYSSADLVLAYYSPLQTTIEEVEAEKTAYNVTINVEVLGAEGYVACAMPSAYCTPEDVEYQKEQMAMAMGQGQYYGKYYTESYSGSALDIAAGTSYSMTGNYSPASEVYVFVLPLDGRAKEDYTAADVVSATFTTSELTDGGSIDVTATQVEKYMGKVYDYDIWDYVEKEIVLDPYTELGVEVNLSVADDFSAFYFSWLDAATYAEYAGYDEDLVDYLLENSYGMSPVEIEKWPLYLTETVSPNTTMHFVAFVVDKAGKYGKLAHVKATSKELQKADFEWTEPYTVNLVDGVLKNTTTLKFTPVFEGGVEAASYKYVLVSTQYYNQYEGQDDAQMAETLYFSTSSDVKTVSADELVNGVLYVEGHSYGKPYYFAILPIDADGNPGASAALLEYECVLALDEVYTEGEGFEATKPTVTLNLPADGEFYPDGGYPMDEDGYQIEGSYYGYEYQEYYDAYHFYYEINYTVNPVPGTEVTAQLVDTKSYTLGDDAATKAGQLWSESLGSSYQQLYATELADSKYKYVGNYMGEPAPALILCVSWKDADGNMYWMQQDVQPELQKYADKMTAMINGGSSEELTVAGKQWILPVEAASDPMLIGMPARSVLDLGVSQADYLLYAVSMEDIYGESAAGVWQQYGGLGTYSVTATDATSGVVTMQAYNAMFDEYTSVEIPYKDLTETTCTFDFTDLLMIGEYTCTLSEEVIPVMTGGVM